MPTADRRPTGVLLLLLLFLLLPATLGAQAEADALFRDFAPFGQLAVEIDGEPLEGAELFHAERAGAYLLIAPSLKSPLLVNVRSRQVERVSFMKIRKNDGGTVDLLADASFDTVGPFQVGAKALNFALADGRKVTLSQKPSLLGFQTNAGMADYNPAYGYKAKEYAPKSAALDSLRTEGRDVTVRVYFGSWCPVCGRLVPKVMALENALAGSKMQFEYYGLPQPMSDDPVAEEMGIHGVPTAVIFSGGKEIGRLGGRELYAPEAAIRDALGGA
ncbi:MAG: thioredoxin family protein [Acidobacteriota bacterium]